MMDTYLHPVMHFLHAHPHWGGMITFLVAFIESLALLGTIIPGSVTMTAIGVLVGAGILPVTSTFMWAIIGALCGDTVSYWAGFRYTEQLRTLWPLRKHTDWLEWGEKFFAKHGGKSVIIGRFVGPMRSLIPMVAGFLKLQPTRFFPAIIVSAIGWSVVYLVPGILIGALAIELPPGVATKFIIYCLVLLVIIWLLSWFIKRSASGIAQFIDNITEKMWVYFTTHHYSNFLVKLLTDRHQPENHSQLKLLFLFLLSGTIFLLILASVVCQFGLTAINPPLQHLIFSFRNGPTDNIMVAIALLANEYTLLMMAGLLVIVLLIGKQWRLAIHWIVLVIGSAGIIWLFKHSIPSPRPQDIIFVKKTGSFPSGHFTFAVSLLGFLAVLIADGAAAIYRKLTFHVVCWLLFVIAISRIYLGTHWPTDIIGGIFLGWCCILFILISLRRKTTEILSGKKLALAAGLCLLISWIGYGSYAFNTVKYQTTPYSPTFHIGFNRWWQHKQPRMPLYRENRFGHPSEAFNLQYLGSAQKLKQILTSQGWQTHPVRYSIKAEVARLRDTTVGHHLPIFPKLHHNMPPILIMTKAAHRRHTELVLHLWTAHFQIIASTEKLWIGSIDYWRSPPKRFLGIPHRREITYPGAIQKLTGALKKYKSKIITLPIRQQPRNMWRLHWNGKILLLQQP